MENNELQRIWKTIDSGKNKKSEDELELLLRSKTRQTVNKFLAVTLISIIASLGLLTFLVFASLNRQNDPIYLTNNIILGIITIISLISGLVSWYKIQDNMYNQPLKNWLEVRIDFFSRWLTGKFSKLYIVLIPLLYILTVLSIHVYYEEKTFTEVLNTEESIFGLIFSVPVGLFVAYYAVRKIRKYQLKNLEFLRDLYGRLCKIS